MKQIFLCLLAASLTLSLAACGGSGAASESETASAVTSASAESAPLSGGWQLNEDSTATVLPERVQKAFDKATEQLEGNELVPVAYLESQVVAGTNYAILCRSTPVTEKPVTGYQMVILYQDLKENAKITKITDFDLADYVDTQKDQLPEENLSGGWTVAEDRSGVPLPKDAQKAFDKAMEQIAGSDLDPLYCLGSQVVAGTNYAILCAATPETQKEPNAIQVVTIYQDLDGKVEFKNFCTLDMADYNQ